MTINEYKIMKLKNFNKPDIEQVIKWRIASQTNIRRLYDEFGAEPNYILNPLFIRTNYLKWPEEKREKFLLLIGGEVNLRKTKEFYHQKLAEV